MQLICKVIKYGRATDGLRRVMHFLLEFEQMIGCPAFVNISSIPVPSGANA